MAIQTTPWVKDDQMTEKAPTIVNLHTVLEIAADVPAARKNFQRPLTPAMKEAGPGRFGMGRLGMTLGGPLRATARARRTRTY